MPITAIAKIIGGQDPAWVQNVAVTLSSGAIGIHNRTDHMFVVNCDINTGGTAVEATRVTTVQGCRLSSATGSTVEVSGGNYGTLITDCRITGDGVGVTLEGFGAVVSDNYIAAAQDGIVFDEAFECAAYGNMIDSANQDTGNTYDLVRIEADSERNTVQANKLLPSPGSPRYGVNVVSGAIDSIVVGNDLGKAAHYGTAPLVDAGTGTQLVFPNDMTNGDNFTT